MSEGSDERERSLIESAELDEEPKTVFEDIMDIDDYRRRIEDGIRADVILAQELAEDPTNWELTEITKRLCTIDIYLGTSDMVGVYDGRCVSLAKTKIQEAIMWLNRAYYQERKAKIEAEKKVRPKTPHFIAQYEGEEDDAKKQASE